MTVTHNTDTDTARQLRDSVEGAAAELRAIAETGEYPPGPYTEDGETPTLIDWLDTFVVTETATNAPGHFYGACLSVTVGGPNVWVEFDKGDVPKVHGAWGSDRHTVEVYAPALCSELAEFAEEYRASH